MIDNSEMNSSNFAYTATIKLNVIEQCSVQKEFPGISDLAVSSRIFPNYFDCSNSVKSFMNGIASTINSDMEDDCKYMITTEVNPVYSGVDTKSKEWGAGELARIWMFAESKEEDDTIDAVGQARVFMTSREATQLN